jgi:hypothetical protein
VDSNRFGLERLFVQKTPAMRQLLAVLILALTAASCQKPDTITPDTLTGVWVEKFARRDTLVFNLSLQGQSLPNMLRVNRGKELNTGGYLLPKIGSGLYDYKIVDNRISVINLFSSSNKRSEYAIEQNGDKLRIENFFELGFNQPATATRTLVRLK